MTIKLSEEFKQEAVRIAVTNGLSRRRFGRLMRIHGIRPVRTRSQPTVIIIWASQRTGWAVSDKMKKDMAIRALDIAVNIALLIIKRNCKPTACAIDKRQRQLLLHCVDCDVLQKPDGRGDLAAEVVNKEANRSRHLPVYRRVLQHPPLSLISRWHQTAGVRNEGGIMRSVTGTKQLQV